ncbi:iron-containing alcohol dehydrogenase family protein [Pseudobacteriovorax antillogorgiicola]|uniref:3-deoxy-alpha-D-manno-octulosonate 8-oxidase n=1 Tax=Pseudobacteriovorax antillogorgiicola TaxID=1513793 RepID=A0A1Y6CSC6_9BACT|nr:iron-containing alcohol dehydrogenase family protein [Pseudobacteriovorax antillogorgiicola]TCS45186.1 3-deoxy-alpha-D-manno-octulosonate 8-oxidase [Pseudobacteriovorax antillogorgiicola]SMF75658.1 3-deoxy-alpha-D-manno-octulosonate 8-oxidase [Pseudobacteriovorax antillogorgiicola]
MAASKNVSRYSFGVGAIDELAELVKSVARRASAIYLIDDFFKSKKLPLNLRSQDKLIYIDNTNEPSTEKIDSMMEDFRSQELSTPDIVIGIGGGSTLDTAKAVSNMFTNEGSAADYQGWDLVKRPGVFKVGIPTISGTGAEASRTCVLTNYTKNIKLGMNSNYSVFDYLILDPSLTKTVPREQYFYTGMDTYIHCIESLNGNLRHPVADAFSREALRLCEEVFLESDDMMSDDNRAKLMTASYLGGASIANTMVGLIHPFSAGLSIAKGTHHCEANCIAFNALGEFYPSESKKFQAMLKKQDIVLRSNIVSIDDTSFETLHTSTLVHEKPLLNALGDDYRKILNKNRTKELFLRM